jgi:nucleoside 2-deoxyribosyltransferase
MKIYIASRYSRRNEMRQVARALQAAGATVTSHWLSEDKPLQTQMGDDPDDFYIETSRIDLADIDSSDMVLFFAEDPLVGIPRGGRHVEFGYALGKGKWICVIGPKENVFHYHPRVFHYNSVHEFMESNNAAY